MSRRAAFADVWARYLPRCTEDDFKAWRFQQAHTAWKYAMWDAGCKMPMQTVDEWTKCLCGAPISVKSTVEHIQGRHMEGMPTEAALLQTAT